MSNETKYQVFISSTYTDLIEARSAAINTVLESYNFPVGMELFGADNDEQWTIIRELIDSSDFYILILGHRYGSISKQNGISFTEKEFDYAINKGVKLLCFVRNDNVATHPHERDANNENAEKLNQFRQKVLTDRLCEFWDNVDDLKHKISSSLYKNMRKHGGIGWVRGNQVSGQLAEELAKLSEENRKLREENERLKQSVSTKRPNLKVSVNEINNIEQEEDEFLEINWKQLREDYFFVIPEKRASGSDLKKINDIGVNTLLIGRAKVDEFIDEYNNNLDLITDNVLKQHHIALRDYHFIEMGKGQIIIDISNFGNAIANKVSVEIEFPSFVFVVDDSSFENLEYYKDKLDRMIIGRIETPEERYQRFFSPMLSMDKLSYIPDFPLEHPYKNSRSQIVIFEFDSLLHSRNITRKNIYLLPKSTGEGTVKVNIMCSEYETPVFFEIPLQVVE